MSAKYIDELLRKVRAIIASGAGTPAQLAAFVFPGERITMSHRVSVSKWLGGSRSPGGSYALSINEWAAAKTLEIDKAGDKARAAYRKAYEESK